MWILTSMGRPDRIGVMRESYQWGGESSVLLTLSENDKRIEEYLSQRWPENWRVEVVPILGNGPIYNEIFRRYPNEKFFGLLADDVKLDIPGMLTELEREAGRDCVAYANDQHHGEAICTMPCIGGDLVRRVGYLAPKNMVHWGVDCVWHEIGGKLGKLRYRPDLTYTHLHPLFGTGKMDSTYQAAQNASMYYRDFYRAWAMNELPRIVAAGA